jgi:hypothetical protein
MEDIRCDLQRRGHRAAKLGQVPGGRQQAAAPARSEGSDRSGAVTAVIGPDGLPETIQVRPGWRSRIPDRAFGSAVAEACAFAGQFRAVIWSQALSGLDWPDRLDHGPERAGGPRSIDEIAEDVIRTLEEALSAAARMRDAPPRGIGASSERNLVISLAPDGQVSCEVDPRWVEKQTEPALNQALSTALAAARQSLAGMTKGAGANVTARTSQLISEIHAAAGAARLYPGT